MKKYLEPNMKINDLNIEDVVLSSVGAGLTTKVDDVLDDYDHWDEIL